MPRTTTLECPGCPRIRALAFDSLGLIKVIEARDKEKGVPKVVDRWGDPDSSKGVVSASINDSKSDPLLAVARKNGAIDVLNPLNGDLSFSIPNVGDAVGQQQQDDAVVGLHLFKKQKLDQATRSCTLLTWTTKGNASMRSFNLLDLRADTSCIGSPKTWKVCSSGNILCAKVDGSENHAVFGGKGVEVNVWDLENCTKVWTAKSPPKNNLGIFTPTWFTSATFMSHDDHRKFVAGTNDHQVRLYDISAQRRPVLSFDFRDTTIKSVAEDLDGHTIYVGNGSGDLASFDIRTGKLLGCFLGKCSGSIRSIARHPEHPVIASCGLDSYLRLWDIKSRQLLSAIFLKQHLTSVVFDSGFNDEEVPDVQAAEEIQNVEEIEELVASKRKKSKDKGSKKTSTEDKEGSKKLKAKKRRKKVQGDSSDDDDDL